MELLDKLLEEAKEIFREIKDESTRKEIGGSECKEVEVDGRKYTIEVNGFCICSTLILTIYFFFKTQKKFSARKILVLACVQASSLIPIVFT